MSISHVTFTSPKDAMLADSNMEKCHSSSHHPLELISHWNKEFSFDFSFILFCFIFEDSVHSSRSNENAWKSDEQYAGMAAGSRCSRWACKLPRPWRSTAMILEYPLAASLPSFHEFLCISWRTSTCVPRA